MRRGILTLLLALAWVGPSHAATPATRPASPGVVDINGVSHRPLEIGDAKASVIIFISTVCPISNGYAPEINRLCQEYESKGVRFYLVHGDAELSDENAKKHAEAYRFACPVLIDRKHVLLRNLGVKRTPEVAVVGPDCSLLYRGRIDDLYVSIGKRRFAATTHDLRDALDAILSGKAVPSPRTQAVGCAISDE